MAQDFRVVCVSYDAFDETEKSGFPDMVTETEKIENYIKENCGGKIHATYGCSLGGSFVGLLAQRRNIHISHIFAWLSGNGYEAAAVPAAEALWSQFSWIVVLSETFMLPPFLYWFYLQVSGRTVFPKWMAFTNVLVVYVALQFVKSLLPDTPFRIGFTSGLMSESMFIWFGIMLIWHAEHFSSKKDGGKAIDNL